MRERARKLPIKLSRWHLLKKPNRVQLNPPLHILPQRCRRMQRSYPHRLLPVSCLNDEEAAHQLRGFGIGPVGHDRLAAARTQGEGDLSPPRLAPNAPNHWRDAGMDSGSGPG